MSAAARAGRSGARVLDDVRAGLARGWPPGVTVLTGDDTYHLDHAQKAILAALVPASATEFALTVFGEERVDVSAAVGAARSVGMFDPRRVVLVRGAETLEGDPAALEAYAAAPPPGSFLVIRAPALDKRFKLHKALARVGTTLTFDRGAVGSESELRAIVDTMAKERDLEVGREVAVALLQSSELDLHAVASELDKLSAYLGGTGQRTVRPRDLREVAIGGAAVSGFEIAQAVLARDLRTAITECRRLVARGEEPIRLLGGLAYYARILLQAKAMAERRVPRQRIQKLRGAWGMGDELFRGLERYRLDELLAFPYHLAEADRALKSRGLDPGAILESVVRRLLQGTAPEGR